MESIFDYDLVIIFIRLLAAAALAGIIGIEREMKRHPAGFRTHMLVGTGACLVMVMALFGFQDYLRLNENIVAYDPSRLASYVISGVGFLGAGTIIVQGASIKGLTTAASIWVVAAIGLAAGAGMYIPAAFATLIVLLSLLLLNKVDRLFRPFSTPSSITVTMYKYAGSLSNVIQALEKQKITITKVKEQKTEEGKDTRIFTIHVEVPNSTKQADLYEALYSQSGTVEVEVTMTIT